MKSRLDGTTGENKTFDIEVIGRGVGLIVKVLYIVRVGDGV